MRALVRHAVPLPGRVETIETGDLLQRDVEPDALAGCDVLVNLAARVHVAREISPDPTTDYMIANTELPLRLAAAAAAAGVQRFVQMSSVAAISSLTPPGVVFGDGAPEEPQNAYGYSKLQADLQLMARSDLSTISIRPPAVYGSGVGAHFRMLMRSAELRLPLPLGAINNSRSFIFVDNLANAIVAAAASAAEGCFIVTDSSPISTAELYRRLLRLYGRSTLVPALPAGALEFALNVLMGGRSSSVIGDSAFSGSRFDRIINWQPQFSMDEALRITVSKDHAC